jgi:hypothetical protein
MVLYAARMRKRSSKKSKKREDASQSARRIVNELIRRSELEPHKNPAAVALGRLGGKSGGPARAAALTPERRSEIARRAASARWKDHHKDPT